MTAVNVMCETMTLYHHSTPYGSTPNRVCDGCGKAASLSAEMTMSDGATIDIATCADADCFHVFAPVRDVLAVEVEG